MKKFLLIVFSGWSSFQLQGQSVAGITGVRDTSYNIINEYNKLLKNYSNLEMVTASTYPHIAEEKNIPYCSTKERELKLDVFYPAGKSERKRIAIIFIHGGGWRSGNKEMHYPLLRKLASLGYVCIAPEYRLSTEALYPAATEDIKTVIRWVRKQAAKFDLDINKIVAAGHSAGGELAAFIGATNGMAAFEGKGCYKEYSSKVNAVIDLDGILAFIHPESGEGDDSKRISAATHWFGYSKTENPELWKQASPLTHVGKHTPPTQFINSGVARMHAGREDFITILEKHNIYSEVRTFEGSPHSFILFNPWFDSTVMYMDKFLRQVFSREMTAQHNHVSKAWVADNGNGTYKNPVINADYSDPDAIRVGEDYYLVSSSFNHAPGLPILHSKDLVNWTIIGHALKRQPPFDHFSKVQHGNGVWAPSIRHYKNEFYIYYPDPDFGIYVIKAKNITGPWSDPVLVEGGKGLIDPCPLWDDNGKIYLVHAYAGSRAGIKSVIVVKQMNAEGTKVIDNGVLVYDGHDQDPTIEGPKFYKRNGYYYIFAPAGGVSTGWQLVLRSKNIYGPYERKVVMDQGATIVNGPHQGAWVDTKTGEHWFLHFQDKDAYGRVVHLQPVKWINDWPVIGDDKDGDGKGEPVVIYKKPSTGKIYPVTTPADTDEFNESKIGLQWQWQANPQPYWAFPSNGKLRLFSYELADTGKSYWDVPNLLMQKFPADEFMVTTKLSFRPRLDGEKTGLIVLGADYAYISLVKKGDGNYISYSICKEADKGKRETVQDGEKVSSADIYFRVKVMKGAVCEFSYSEDGKSFKPFGEKLVAKPGRWVGAKTGLFCTRTVKTNDAGYADVDWFRIEAIP